MFKRSLVLFVVLGLSTAASAQEDDLAPLAPVKAKTKPKPKPAPKPKPKTAPRPKTATPAPDDDLAPIAPIARTGEVHVQVPASVAGAVLSIDGREVGILPLQAQTVSSGEHTLMVKRPGYAAFVKKVQVGGGKKVEIDAKLIAVAAVLSVTSDVAGANVLINGRNIGSVPLQDVEVPAGPAEIAVVKEGFREDTQRINFVAGRDYPIVVKFNPGTTTQIAARDDRPVSTNLTPAPVQDDLALRSSVPQAEPITSKWYFWVGIAAGVAAVAAGTAIGVAEHNKSVELTEEKLCGKTGGCSACIGVTCHPAGVTF